MIKFRLFWWWTVIIIYDHAIFHVHRNPVKRKVIFNLDGKKVYEGTVEETYPAKGE